MRQEVDPYEYRTVPDEDQVVRRRRFQEANPAWHFISPREPRSLLIGETRWRVIAPDGEVIRDAELSGALDQAEKKAAEGIKGPEVPH